MVTIAGVIQANGSAVERSCVDRMAALVPFGEPKLRYDAPVVLIGNGGFAADLLDHRDPPLICFDGRIDNRGELLALIGDRGRARPRGADADIALALYLRFGEAFVERLVGDFAFAIWRRDRRRLFAARSATGWRPFFWTCDPRRFAFASEPVMLVRGLDLSPALNEGLIGEIVSARLVNETETPWQGISRLAPGGALSYEAGRIETWRWYRERFEDVSHLSEADHVDRFNMLFDDALIACTRSDAPVAAQLSGGLDSSSVLCRSAELYRDGRIAQPIRAVSARYPGEPHDETAWSGLVEQHSGLSARVVSDVPYDIAAARTWCAQTMHLPIRPNALGPSLATFRLMREAGEHVLLTGEGGDDWLKGSRAHWPDLLLKGRIPALLREGFRDDTKPFAANLRALVMDSLGPTLSAARRRRVISPLVDRAAPAPPWIRPEWASRLALADRWRDPDLPAGPKGFAQHNRYAAMAPPHRELVFDPILACAARHGVELRHPFHDLRLIRFVMGAAGGMLLREDQPKYLLREAMRGTLPEPIRMRRDKAHFAGPVIDAIDRYFTERAPTRLLATRMGWLDGAEIVRLFDEHRSWRRSGLVGSAPNPFLNGIWYCVAMDIWLENAFGAAP